MSESTSLLERLQSESTETLREACFEAADQKLDDAVPLLCELLKSHNLGVQEASEQALRKIGGKQTVDGVIPLLRSDDAPVRNLAMDILREVGNQDINSLIALVYDQDPDIRIFTTDILGSADTVMAVEPLCNALLKDPEVNVRYQAAVSLGELAKPEAAKCLNKAVEDDEWVQYAVVEALAKIKHSSSVGAMAKALDKSSDLVASMIIDALGEMGNVQAVTMLLRRMEASPTALRNKIVKAIIKILGGKSLTLLTRDERENFRQYMLVALEDEDTEIQDAAILGLGFVGGEEAASQVLRLAGSMDPDRDHDRLEAAIDSLANIGPTKALKFGLDEPGLARVAVEGFARMEEPEVSEVLMEAFEGKDRDLQRDIVSALIKVAGPEAKGFFLDVLETHQDGTVLKAAMSFLGGKLRDVEAAPVLFSMLDHKWDDVKEAALEACVAIGGQDMVERFKDFSSSEDPLHRLMAVYALGELGDAGNLEILTQALEDEIPDIRKVALEAISNLVADDGTWLDIVVSRMNDESRDVRLALAELLGKRYSPVVIPSLLELLEDDDDWVRIRGMEALGLHREESAVPKLVAMLENPNRLLAMKAVEALGNTGGTVAFRSLLEVGDLEDPELTQAVEEAIAKIQAEIEEES